LGTEPLRLEFPCRCRWTLPGVSCTAGPTVGVPGRHHQVEVPPSGFHRWETQVPLREIWTLAGVPEQAGRASRSRALVLGRGTGRGQTSATRPPSACRLARKGPGGRQRQPLARHLGRDLPGLVALSQNGTAAGAARTRTATVGGTPSSSSTTPTRRIQTANRTDACHPESRAGMEPGVAARRPDVDGRGSPVSGTKSSHRSGSSLRRGRP